MVNECHFPKFCSIKFYSYTLIVLLGRGTLNAIIEYGKAETLSHFRKFLCLFALPS